MKPISHGGPRKSPSDPGARKLVLYVEAEESNRKVAQLRLGRTYDLLLATNDREACEILATQGSALYAVLMDIELKGSTLSGIQLTQLLRGRLAPEQVPSFARNVPVLDSLLILFVSAYGGRYQEEELVKHGGNKLISKPVNFIELTSAITFFHLDRARSGR